jgi:parallel beta-helix repeat protein
MFTNFSWKKSVKALPLILIVAIVAALLPATLASALKAPAGTPAAPGNVGPRLYVGGADPANGIYVSPTGNDAAATGSISAPYKSINAALAKAQPGGTVILREGVYHEGTEVRLRKSNITIKSREGEWAVIELPIRNPDCGENSAVACDPEVSGFKLQSVEVIGGFYAISLNSKWGWHGNDDWMAASNITIEDCMLHDSKYEVVKVKPNCNDVTIRYCEIYNAGRAELGTANWLNGEGHGEAIDNVQGDRMTVQNNYMHDLNIGIYAKGGAADCLFENNIVENALGAGIQVGFDTNLEWFDSVANPQYYESIRCIVRNNLIIDAGWEGIGLYASKDAQVYNNTVVDAVNGRMQYHSALYFGVVPQDGQVGYGHPANVNADIHIILFASGPHPIAR